MLALGGGAVLDPATRQLLRGHTGGLPRGRRPRRGERVGLASGRPLLSATRGQPQGLMDERRPVYEQVATVVVTDGRTPEDVAAEVVTLVKP